jgi:hypothetical protein
MRHRGAVPASDLFVDVLKEVSARSARRTEQLVGDALERRDHADAGSAMRVENAAASPGRSRVASDDPPN